MAKLKDQKLQSSHLIDLLKSFCLGGKPVAINNDAVNWSIKTGLAAIVTDYGISNSNGTSSVTGKLPAEKLTAQFWSQTQLTATKKIVSELNAQGIVPTLLKGISISSSYYPKPHYRMMRDIDILVDVEEIDKVEKILPCLDYKQRSTYSKKFYSTLHHTMPWQHCKDEIWIEVHKRLFPKTSPCYNSPIFQLEIIQQEKIIDDFYGLKVYRLSKEFQIVYIATHWAERFKLHGGVFALLDIALIINKHNDELDWDKIISWSNTACLSNYVYLILHYLSYSGLLKEEVSIVKYTNRLEHTLRIPSYYILSLIITNYLLAGKPFSRVLTINNISIIWKHLLSPRTSLIKVATIPLAVLFPKGKNKGFSLKFQWIRFKSLIGYKKGC